MVTPVRIQAGDDASEAGGYCLARLCVLRFCFWSEVNDVDELAVC